MLVLTPTRDQTLGREGAFFIPSQIYPSLNNERGKKKGAAKNEPAQGQ
jgi:hypothetical protein